MVAITLMQPLGQVAAAAVGLTVLTTLGKRRGLELFTETPDDHKDAAAIIDSIWRIVIGVGAIPAFLAIAARLTIPESPRFTLDVSLDGRQALKANQEYLGEPVFDEYIVLDFEGGSIHNSAPPSLTGRMHPPRPPPPLNADNISAFGDDSIEVESYQLRILDQTITNQGNGDLGEAYDPTDAHEKGQTDGSQNLPIGHPSSRSIPPHNRAEGHDNDEEQNPFDELPREDPKDNHPFSRAELYQYFIAEGNWRQLAGCSICWFCLDFAFYGLGINNPRVVADIWASSHVSNNSSGSPMWANPADPALSIYNALYQDSLHYIITISIGSLLGSIVLLKAIDYIPRKSVLAWSFVVLGVTFAIMGGIYATVAYTDLHAFLIVFYALLQLLFNLGPNTIIFLVSSLVAELSHPCLVH